MSIPLHIEDTSIRLFGSAEDAGRYADAISFEDDPWSATQFDCGWLVHNQQGVYRDEDGILPDSVARVVEARLALSASLAASPSGVIGLNLLPVTLWSRKNEKGEWEFNHLEDGHVAAEVIRPTPKHENHKTAWRKGDWRALPGYLTADVPPRVVA